MCINFVGGLLLTMCGSLPAGGIAGIAVAVAVFLLVVVVVISLVTIKVYKYHRNGFRTIRLFSKKKVSVQISFCHTASLFTQ